MESIQEINNGNSLGGVRFFEEQGRPVSEESNASAGSQRVQSSGAGMEKLRAEEARIQAGIQEALKRRQKGLDGIRKIALDIKDSHLDEWLPLSVWLPIIGKIAGLDFHLAKKIVDSRKEDVYGSSGYVFLSRFANEKEAAELLNQVKDKLNKDPIEYGFFLLLQIYQEEKRRGFPEAEKTFAQLQLQLPNYRRQSIRSDVARLWFAYQYQLPKKEEMLSDLLPKNGNRYNFFNFLQEMEGWPQEMLDFILSGFEEACKEETGDIKLYEWGSLFRFEGKHSQFQDRLKQDLAHVLELVKRNPKQASSQAFFFLIKYVAPIAPDQAERFVEFIGPKRPGDEFAAKVEVFIGKTKNPTFDRKGEFAKFEEETRPYLDLDGKGPMCVFGSFGTDNFGTYNSLLFKAAYAALGEEARPYFYKAASEVGIEGTTAPRICDLFFRNRLAESTHVDLAYGDLLEMKIVQAVFELHECQSFDS